MIEILYVYSQTTGHISGALRYHYACIEVLKESRYCVHINMSDFHLLRALYGVEYVSYEEHRKRLGAKRKR
jgi:hypothetical protein